MLGQKSLDPVVMVCAWFEAIQVGFLREKGSWHDKDAADWREAGDVDDEW